MPRVVGITAKDIHMSKRNSARENTDPASDVNGVEDASSSVASDAPGDELVVDVTLEHTSPMLQSQMDEDTVFDTLVLKKKQPIDTSSSKEERAEKARYQGPNGEFGFPILNASSCFIDGGRYVKFDARRCFTSNDSTVLPAFLRVRSSDPNYADFVPFLNQEKYKVDVRRGVNRNGASKITVGIVRPRFDSWAAKVRLVISIKDGVTEQSIRRIVEVAGERSGLCSFRPQKKGPFGCFKIGQWVIVSDSRQTAGTKAA